MGTRQPTNSGIWTSKGQYFFKVIGVLPDTKSFSAWSYYLPKDARYFSRALDPFASVTDSSLFGTCNMVSEKTGYFLVYIGLEVGIETPS